MNNLLKFLVLICVFLLQSEVILADTQAPRAVLNTDLESFGKVEQGTIVTGSFELRNEGSSPLNIRHVEVSSPGMKVRAKQQIAPGSSAMVRINLDTSRFSGEVEESALIKLNDAKHPKALLTLKGTVVPPIDILPIPAFYMSQFKGEEKARSLVIQNNQEHEVKITKVEARGTHFVPKLETVEAGQVYKLWAKIPSSAPAGRYREAVVLHTDDPKYPSINIEVNVLVKSDVYITPEKADFGAIDLSQVKLKPGLSELIKQSFIIKRRQGTMVITDIKSDIPFLNIGKMPSGQSEGFNLELEVDFKQAVVGPFKGTVTLETDDSDWPVLEIPVSGVIR